MSQPHPGIMSRRQALELAGKGALATAALSSSVFAQTPSFPKGAIIRTLSKDYAPEELAGGATLFHEHMSLGPDFNERFRAASAAVRAANGPAPATGAGGGARPAGAAPVGGGAGGRAGGPPTPAPG